MNLNQIHNVYFIGIGGIGMSALARYFQFIGKKVVGYDKTPTQLTDELQAIGLEIHFEDNISLIPEDFYVENTLVIVTADHETGGLTLSGGDVERSISKGTFSTKGHSATMVPVFSYGPNAELFKGIYENTAIFDKMLESLTK